MLFCQLGKAQSLREIHEGLKVSEGKLVHLGMTKSPGHSTLAYANLHRPWQIYQDLFTALVPHLRAKLPVSAKTPLTVPGKLFSLDSTMVDLCAAVFDWAKYKTTKGAVKIHLLLDHDGLMPHYAVITEGKTSDIAVARTLDLPKGAMVVFDRGYCDYTWFAKLTSQEIRFVTRLKTNASFVVVESRPVTPHTGVLRDEVVVFTQHATEDNERFFRRIVYWDEELPTRVRVSHQPSHTGRRPGGRRIPATLADRTAFSGAQTESENQDFRGHLGQRTEDSNLDSIDCLVTPSLPAITKPPPMAPQPLRSAAAPPTLCLSRPLEFPRQPVRGPAAPSIRLSASTAQSFQCCRFWIALATLYK